MVSEPFSKDVLAQSVPVNGPNLVAGSPIDRSDPHARCAIGPGQSAQRFERDPGAPTATTSRPHWAPRERATGRLLGGSGAVTGILDHEDGRRRRTEEFGLHVQINVSADLPCGTSSPPNRDRKYCRPMLFNAFSVSARRVLVTSAIGTPAACSVEQLTCPGTPRQPTDEEFADPIVYIQSATSGRVTGIGPQSRDPRTPCGSPSANRRPSSHRSGAGTRSWRV